LTLALLISLHHLSFLSLLPSLEHASKLLTQQHHIVNVTNNKIYVSNNMMFGC
jgi:hypothetical protein